MLSVYTKAFFRGSRREPRSSWLSAKYVFQVIIQSLTGFKIMLKKQSSYHVRLFTYTSLVSMLFLISKNQIISFHSDNKKSNQFILYSQKGIWSHKSISMVFKLYIVWYMSSHKIHQILNSKIFFLTKV